MSTPDHLKTLVAKQAPWGLSTDGFILGTFLHCTPNGFITHIGIQTMDVGQLTIKDSQQRKYLSCTAELETLVNSSNQNLLGAQN